MGLIFTCMGGGRRLDYIDQTLSDLKIAGKVLSDKIELLDARSVRLREEAKKHVREQRRQSALLSLRQSKLVVGQARQASAYAARLSELYSCIESGLLTLAVANALRQARDTMVHLNAQIDLKEIDNLLQEIRENVEDLQEASEAVSAPELRNDTYDEEELERELAALVGDSEEGQEVVASVPVMPSVPSTNVSTEAREPIEI